MAIKLVKGQKVDVNKNNPGLHKIVIGLGWDVNKAAGVDFDIDAAAFLLASSGKVHNENDFIFYNNPSGGNHSVIHCGDNRTGEGDGDDEQIKIDLRAVPANIDRIAFTITIHEAETRRQNFGLVQNAYVRVFNPENNEELIRYNLSKDFSVETAIVAAELYRNQDYWKFNAIGSGFKGGLGALCRNFGIEVEDEDSETPTHETPNAANVPTAKTPASSPSPQIPLTKIDLLKKKVDITLEKKKLSGIVAKVALILDISGSMTSLYKKGTVQNVVERTAAVASRLDDDGVLDIWIYSQDFWRMPAVTENNYLGYVKREILDKKKSLGKIFSINNEPPVMEDVVKKYTKQEKSPFPVYLVFITDGGIYKDREIKKILISASKEPIFWQFVGIGKANYGILSELDTMGGRYVDNANFFALDDIDKISDDEIYDRLLNEFPMWIRDAKAKGILK